MPQKLNESIVLAAIEGFESQKRRIDEQIAELRQMLGGAPIDTATPVAPTKRRRKMSAAARKRIGDAQRKRWAESKQTSSPVAPEPTKKKRKLSAAGKKAIVEATKRRWARVRAEAAEAAKASQAPAKKGAKRAPTKAARKSAKKTAAKRTKKAATAQAAGPAGTE